MSDVEASQIRMPIKTQQLDGNYKSESPLQCTNLKGCQRDYVGIYFSEKEKKTNKLDQADFDLTHVDEI